MHATASIRRGTGALAALVAAGALAVPASAATLSDAYPSPQAIAANAEFLAQVPAPPGGPGVVCVIDTGVTPLPDTASQIVERIAIDGGTPDDIDHVPGDPRSGHGSFVAGVIASQVDGRGSAGIWPAAKIISVRVFRSADSGAIPADYMSAITECTRDTTRNVRVVSISLGSAQMGSYESARLEDRIDEAHRYRNTSIVASGGNASDQSTLDYPARLGDSFGVGATDVSGALCPFSNRGVGLDISALGCNVYASAFDGSAQPFAGTSYAAPTVAGILLALRAYRPDLTPQQPEQTLLSSARTTAAGRVIDAAAAFRLAGLGDLIASYKPPSPYSDNTTANGKGRSNFDDDGRPGKPKLRSASFVRGTIRIRVSGPRRRGWRVIFRINDRRYSRSSGALAVRARAWKSVSVVMEDQWGDRSEPLNVRRPRRH